MENIKDISLFCKVIDRGSKNTIVLFSPVNFEKGKFAYYSYGMNIKMNVIFLNTANDHWYYDGVPGLGNDYSETVKKLESIIKSMGDENVVFIGGSMGGYGAIMYGALIQSVTKVIAFGPELEINIPHGISKPKLRDCTYSYLDSYKLIKNNPKQYIIIVGENFITDVFGAAKLYKEKLWFVQIYSLKNLMHNIPPYIKWKYGIDNFLNTLIHEDYKFPFNEEEMGNLYQDFALIQFIYKARGKIALEKQELIFWEKEKELYPKYHKSFIEHALGLVFHRNKELFKAKQFFIQAIKNNPKNIFMKLDFIENEKLLQKESSSHRQIGSMAKNILENYDIDYATQNRYVQVIQHALNILLERKMIQVVMKFLYKFNLIGIYRKEYLRAIEIEYMLKIKKDL